MDKTGNVAMQLCDEAALLGRAPQPNCQVALTFLGFDYETQGDVTWVVRLTVSGLAWGATRVRATLASPWLQQPIGSTDQVANNRWSVTFDFSPSPLPYGASVQLSVLSVQPQACKASAESRLTLSLGAEMGAALHPAEGSPSGFIEERSAYISGHPDRLVFSRSYVPLLCSFYSIPPYDRMVLARFTSRLGVPRRQAFDQIQAFSGRAAQLGAALENRIIAEIGEQAEVRRENLGGMLERAFSEAFSEQLEALPIAPELRMRPAPEAAGEAEAPEEIPPGERGGEAATVVDIPSTGGVTYGISTPVDAQAKPGSPEETFADYQGLTVGRAGWIGVKEGLANYINLGWLGILFYDRLRFRSSGLVVGDQVYSLSLAPGEEATLTQRSETRRSRSFEDVLDRTTERELEFSSTWTTDFSQEDASSMTNTVGGNLSVSATIPIEEVNLGVDAGVNAQSSSTISQNKQRARSRQITSRFSSKAREQHKTTFRVGTEITEEYGSKRVLRNLNPSRALTLHIHKVYQKYRILLERYDARLCASFALYDPGRDLRRELQDELAKLNPHVPPGACPDMPTGGSSQQVQLIENRNAADVGGDEYGAAMFSTVLPAGTVLSSWKFELISWTVDDGNGNRYLANTAEFRDKGGDWWFEDQANIPDIGSAGAQSHIITVLMPEAWGPGWWTVNVTGRFTWSYVPTEQVVGSITTCIEQEMKKIRDSFSTERLEQILAEVSSSRKELIYKRLFEEILLPHYFRNGVNPPIEVLEKVRNYFDWNEAVIEYLPWWMSPSARNEREKLRQQLLQLPGDVRSDLVIDDFLVASLARVFLPIRAGSEQDTVDFMIKVGGYDVPSLKECISDFVKWREQNLGIIQYPLPDYNAVLAPGPALSTPSEAQSWKYDWEKPRRKFLVLDEWPELLPTDGVHIEPVISAGGSVDEFRTSALISDLKSASAAQDSELARAALERELAAGDVQATVVIGNPDNRPR